MAHISHTFRDGSTVSGDRQHVERAIRIEGDMRAQERAWIDQLRAEGIRAAHPDDGWVNREENKIHLCYPQFDAGLAVGDLLALGNADRWRIVRVTAGEAPGPLIAALHPEMKVYYWHFEEA